jgi:hypothetical protein
VIGRRSLGCGILWNLPTAITAVIETPAQPAPAPRPEAITPAPAPPALRRVSGQRETRSAFLARVTGVCEATAAAWLAGAPVPPRCRRALEAVASKGDS